MKNNFITCTLFDIASKDKKSIISGPFGSDIGSRFFQEAGVPVIRGNNLSNGYKKFIDDGFVFVSEEKANNLNAYAIKNDLIFTAAGTIGQVGLIEEKTEYSKYVISNKQLRVRLDINKINPLYAYYWFSSPWIIKDIINKNTGSTVPLINLGVIKSLRIDIPKERTLQDKIALILSTLDSKIELNNRMNAELEAMAKTLYDYWFVQFDFPDAQGKPYKTNNGKMVWNEELKREIPEGWEVLDLEKVENNIVTGKTPSTANESYFNGDVSFICIGDVRGNMHIVETEITLTQAGAEKQNNKFIPKGSICVTCIASPGLVAFTTRDSQTNQQLNSIVCEQLENKYYLYFYLTDYFKYAKAKTGNTFANMNKADFTSIKVIKPKKDILIKFSEIIESSIDKILNNSIENKKLSDLRNWLLPMLMNGQVTVN